MLHWTVFLLSLCIVITSCTENVKDLKFKLNNGNYMPMIGLGTYKIQGADLILDVLDKALAAGYRLIDTAKVYNNEKEIGDALKTLLPKHNLTRNDIFITTKLSPHDQGEKAYDSLKESLKNLNVDYVDLYLIHWPGSIDANNKTEADSAVKRDKSWQQLVKGVKDGLAKNIGVSNYAPKHLKELLKNDHSIKPTVNQVEWHPHYHPQELKDLLNKEGILLQAYFSLGGTDRDSLLKNEEVIKIAEKLKRTPAQVLLRWSIEQDNAIIPKARSQKHLEENIDLNFVIPPEDMKILNEFKTIQYAWNSATVD